MKKVIPVALDLDTEVEQLIQRVAHTSMPRHWLHKYFIERGVNEPTKITVTFIADEQFSQVEQGSDDNPTAEEMDPVAS